MSTENENAVALLQPGQDAGLPSFMGEQSMEVFDQMVRPAYMARIQLCTGMSGLVAEGKMNVGKFALVRGKEDFVDLGDTYNCIPLCWRFAAMRFEPGKFEAYYDAKSDEFKKIQADSTEEESRCAYGPQFLIWIPSLREFVTFLFGSKSARPEARKLNPFLNKGATFKAKLVQNDKNKWHVPVILPCSSPLELFNTDTAKEIADKFNKPPTQEVISEESVAPPVGDGGRAR